MKIDNDPDNNVFKAKEKIKGNPWIAVSIVLGIAVLILLFMVLRGGITGDVVSGEDAAKNLLAFANSQGVDAELVEVNDNGNFYEVVISMGGREAPLYVTKDGKFFTQALIPLTGDAVDNTNTDTETPTDVPKTDKPKVEAFIFSYCPYGLQFEKALFPVYDLLKNSADINIVAIGAMHGEYEKTETLRQISIEQLYGKDKLFAYLKEFDTNTNIGSCSGDDTCLNKYLPTIYTKLGIDKTKVENYMKADALTIYDEQNTRANELGISGSPTFVINDAKVQVERTPDAIKQAVCDAFTTAPSECSQTLSTASASTGFGASAGSANSSAGQCAS